MWQAICGLLEGGVVVLRRTVLVIVRIASHRREDLLGICPGLRAGFIWNWHWPSYDLFAGFSSVRVEFSQMDLRTHLCWESTAIEARTDACNGVEGFEIFRTVAIALVARFLSSTSRDLQNVCNCGPHFHGTPECVQALVSTDRSSGDYRCITGTAVRCSTFHLIYITMHVNEAGDVFPAVVSRRTTLAWLPSHFTEEWFIAWVTGR
jgi:hypothetical protein